MKFNLDPRVNPQLDPKKYPVPVEKTLIERHLESSVVEQRVKDGYVNATALCKACGKLFADYYRLKTTQAYLEELSRSMGIPIDLLVQVIEKGPNELRGTWVHPYVAMNLGQWASAKFAVFVSKWVAEWLSGDQIKNPPQTTFFHLRRIALNRHKIPHNYFSILNQIIFHLLYPLECNGYVVPAKLVPDISLGRIFSGWLRKNGHDPESFPTYLHDYGDGIRPLVPARLYPLEMLSDFNDQIICWITSGKALAYFSERDPLSIEAVHKVREEILVLEQNPNYRKQTSLKDLSH